MANTQKTAILRALIEGSVVEILVKSNIENIVYSVDADGTEVMLSTKLAEILTDLATKDTVADREAAILALKQELLGDTPVEAYNTFTELAEYIEEHQDVADALTAAIGQKADTSTVTALQESLTALTKTVNDLGAMAQKDKVAEDDLDAALKEKVNAASEGNHSHNNKDLLDTYTQTEENLADAVAKKHKHANKAELDKIAEGDTAKWNQAVTDLAAVVADYLKTSDKEALQALITALDGRVTINEQGIATLNGNSSVEGSVDKKIADAINAWVANVTDDGIINTYKEALDYIASHGTEYTALLGEVDKNTKAIETLNGDENTAGSVKKAVADEATRAKAAEEANAAAAAAAKQHATDLNTAMDTRVQAVETKAHEHSNKDVLDGITAENVAAWNVKGRIIYSATQPADLTENDLWVELLD